MISEKEKKLRLKAEAQANRLREKHREKEKNRAIEKQKETTAKIARWQQLIAISSANNTLLNEDSKDPEQYKEVLKLCTKGIPPNMRGTVWPLIIGNEITFTDAEYQDLRKKADALRVTAGLGTAFVSSTNSNIILDEEIDTVETGDTGDTSDTLHTAIDNNNKKVEDKRDDQINDEANSSRSLSPSPSLSPSLSASASSSASPSPIKNAISQNLSVKEEETLKMLLRNVSSNSLVSNGDNSGGNSGNGNVLCSDDDASEASDCEAGDEQYLYMESLTNESDPQSPGGSLIFKDVDLINEQLMREGMESESSTMKQPELELEAELVNEPPPPPTSSPRALAASVSPSTPTLGSPRGSSRGSPRARGLSLTHSTNIYDDNGRLLTENLSVEIDLSKAFAYDPEVPTPPRRKSSNKLHRKSLNDLVGRLSECSGSVGSMSGTGIGTGTGSGVGLGLGLGLALKPSQSLLDAHNNGNNKIDDDDNNNDDDSIVSLTTTTRSASNSSTSNNNNNRGTASLIKWDLPRTFPTLKFFHDGGSIQADLERILCAYTIYRPEVGYVQGMSFVAAMLLLYLDDSQAFSCLCNLLARKGTSDFFSLKKEKIERYVNCFDHFFHTSLPLLFKHMTDQGLSSEMFLLDWHLTIYAKALPLDVAARVWDCYLSGGELFSLKCALGILRLYAPKLCLLQTEELMSFLTHLPQDLLADQLLDSISQIKITSSKYKRYCDAYDRNYHKNDSSYNSSGNNSNGNGNGRGNGNSNRNVNSNGDGDDQRQSRRKKISAKVTESFSDNCSMM
jgi:hypothetical protein